MKKVLCFTFLFVMLAAVSAKAVVIHWAVTNDGLQTMGVNSAQLVYISNAETPTAGDILTSVIGDPVTGLAITPSGIGAQNTTYTPDPTAGSYYVVLFDSAKANYMLSTTSLVWNDTSWDAITVNDLNPATSYFDPVAFTEWTTVPEPGSMALLALGLVAMALRRKKRV